MIDATKLPVWSRWLLALPAAIISVFIANFILMASSAMGIPFLEPNGLLVRILFQQIYIYVFLQIIYDFVPKYKVHILIGASIIIGLLNMFAIVSLMVMAKQYTDTDLVIQLLRNILTFVTLIYINLKIIKEQYLIVNKYNVG